MIRSGYVPVAPVPFEDYRRRPRVGATPDRRPPSAAFLTSVAGQLRAALEAPIPPDRIAAALTEACERWRDRNFPPRRETLSSSATALGHSLAMLDESLDALLKPFHARALKSLASKLAVRRELFGFIMPGNVMGAGLHELCQALLASAAVILKTSSAEPMFFTAFANTLREIDAQFGSRVAVLKWSRDHTEMTAALKSVSDHLVAFGDDDTLASLAPDTRLIGFGSRLSGVLVASDCERKPVADAVARDVTLFEQRGCLSPHHVFVEDPKGGFARAFACDLAASLAELAKRIPPPSRLSLEDAAAIRRARESARWRRIVGDDLEMWEGEDFGWTVIYEGDACFRISPGHRTAYVTPIHDLADLERRLEPVAGRLEAFGLADPRGRLDGVRAHLRAIGVSYIAAPGEMQSPPLDWRHGGGALLDLFMPAK